MLFKLHFTSIIICTHNLTKCANDRIVRFVMAFVLFCFANSYHFFNDCIFVGDLMLVSEFNMFQYWNVNMWCYESCWNEVPIHLLRNISSLACHSAWIIAIVYIIIKPRLLANYYSMTVKIQYVDAMNGFG